MYLLFEMDVEEDLEKTNVADSVEPEANLDIPSQKLADDSMKATEILDEVEQVVFYTSFLTPNCGPKSAMFFYCHSAACQ